MNRMINSNRYAVSYRICSKPKPKAVMASNVSSKDGCRVVELVVAGVGETDNCHPLPSLDRFKKVQQRETKSEM